MQRDRTRTTSVTSRVTARVDGSEGSDNYIRPSFLPTLTRDVAERPLLHRANTDRTGALCGAPVIGVLVFDQQLECVVCADILEGRKINNLDNTKPRWRKLIGRLRRR